MKLVYNVNERPKFTQMIVFAIQQLLAIMAATLVVPVIIGHGMSTVAALFGAGIGTLVYLLFTKGKSPVFLGSSFAFLGSMAAAFTGATTVALGYLGLIIGAVLAGLVYVVIALAVKLAGVGWLNKLMPAVVIGPTVAIIGLSLAGNAVGDLQTTNYTVTHNAADYAILQQMDFNTATGEYEEVLQDGKPVYTVKDHPEMSVSEGEANNFTVTSKPGSVYVALLCGLATLIVTILCATYGKKFISLIPFIIGIAAGYALACVFYLIGVVTNNPALMIMNFAPFASLLTNGQVTLNTFFAVPDFTFLTAFGAIGEMNWQYLGALVAAYVPVAFVVFAEHVADHKNISSIIETDLLEEPGLHRTLLGDGIGSMTGAFFGGCPNTTYGESVACVAITGNASVVTIFTTAILAILISFLNPFVALVNTIPSCVMGGVCVALYGFIAVSGLRMFKNLNLDSNRYLFVVSTILICGIGGLTVTFGGVTITAIAVALILGIVVNILLSRKDKEAAAKE